MHYLRIILVLILAAVIFFGYRYIRDSREAERQAKYSQFAGVISEVSIAAELYRNDKDSFLVVRDSILKKYNLTLTDISDFRNRLKDNQEEWLEIWNDISPITDSLVKYEQERLRVKKDRLSDSLPESK